MPVTMCEWLAALLSELDRGGYRTFACACPSWTALLPDRGHSPEGPARPRSIEKEVER